MFHFITIGILLPLISTLVQANVEKTIFRAPPASTIPSVEPELDDLGLERLSPRRSLLRTGLNASFPTDAAPEGTDSWFFVENLKPGQRYEIRVCWLATVCPSHHSLLTLHPPPYNSNRLIHSNQHHSNSQPTPYPRQLNPLPSSPPSISSPQPASHPSSLTCKQTPSRAEPAPTEQAAACAIQRQPRTRSCFCACKPRRITSLQTKR